MCPDLVITDVVLPGRDGLSLVGQLRQQPATQRTPMIVLTARHGADATAEGLAAGADDYITKPFSSDELLARVHANHELARLREKAVSRAEARGEQIRAGLESNRIIGTAIGILMSEPSPARRPGIPAAGRCQPTQQPQTPRHRRRRHHQRSTPFRPTLTDELLVRVTSTTAEIPARPADVAATPDTAAAGFGKGHP